MMRIGIDVGGTFTDVVLVDEAGAGVKATKVPTTPAAPEEGVLDGLRRIMALAGVRPADIGFVGHGTTIATNMIVEGKGAKTALVATRGFRDVLEFRRGSRHDRADLYDLHFTNPDPLVPRFRRFEIAERVGPEGQVFAAPTPEDLAALAAQIRESDIEAVAVSLLHSYANPAHEEAVATALREALPGVFVTTSSQVNPEMLEYERTSTTVINAMLGPVCTSYAKRLIEAVHDEGVPARPLLMQSNGALADPSFVTDRPVSLLESGPAGGVTAAAKFASILGLDDVIAGDMGGTTFDVSLMTGGAPTMRNHGQVQTHVVRYPTIDIESIGAGGGSLVWVDEGGIRIGPMSAGGDPGPACYGRGGQRATITDCNVVLGYLDPGRFLAGDFALDVDAAHRAVETDIANPLGISVGEAASGARRMANALMAQAMRLATVERGFDPRDFVYLCYGGAGPLHAADLADELEIPRVVIPPFPGVFSAFGMIVADQAYEFQLPVNINLDQLDESHVSAFCDTLLAQARQELEGSGFRVDPDKASFRADCKFQGQADSLEIPLASNTPRDLDAAFKDTHMRQWHFIPDGRAVSLLNLRVRIVVRPGEWVGSGSSVRAEPVGRRTVRMGSAARDLPVYDRVSLEQGTSIEGPCLIEEPSTLTPVPEGWRVSVGPLSALMLERISRQ